MAPAPVISGDEGAKKLQQALSLPQAPRIIEGFDIAHYMGTNVVAAMVQFVDSVPNKNGYRRYRVQGEAGDNDPGNNDFAAMKEVVGRRYRRLRDEGPRLARCGSHRWRPWAGAHGDESTQRIRRRTALSHRLSQTRRNNYHPRRWRNTTYQAQRRSEITDVHP